MESNPTKRRKLDPAIGDKALDPSFRNGWSTEKSSAFVLETDEFLKEAEVDYEAFSELEELLKRLKTCFEGLEPRESLPVHTAAAKLEKESKIVTPFPDPRPPTDSPYKVAFAKPSQYNVVGSYVSRTLTKTQQDGAVDMVLVMPNSIFQEKDYLDYRYFYKRAFYLGVLAAALRKELGPRAVSFACFNDNPLLPILVVDPSSIKNSVTAENENGNNQHRSSAQSPTTGYRIQIIPCVEADLFPNPKLAATKSSVRLASKDINSPTLFYNSTLKAEGTFLAYSRLLRNASRDCVSFKAACILGRTWLAQRGFGGSVSKGGFGHFEWAVLLALLLQHGGSKSQGALSASWSPTQLFKAAIQYLAVTDMAGKSCVLGPKPSDIASVQEQGPVLYDSTRQLNIAFKMTTSSANFLNQHAKWTHLSLRDEFADHVTPSFILKADVELEVFDLVFTIKNVPQQRLPSQVDAFPLEWDFGGKVYRVLNKALGDRARLTHVRIPRTPTWVATARRVTQEPLSLLVGVVLDSANASRQVDHGPSVEEEKEAQKFRQFWGDKAELRRFKDGSILESLVWTGTSDVEICEEIARYVLQRQLHLNYDSGDLVVHGKQFHAVLPIKSTDMAAFNSVRKAFELLEQDVRGLDDLPLHIRQLTPIAPALRYSTVHIPKQGGIHGAGQPPLDAALSFEASGKWPDNLAAIQQTKLALLLRIAGLLESVRPETKAFVGLEEADGQLQNAGFLDAVYENGPAFRLRIQSDLEEELLSRRAKNKALPQYERTKTAQLLATFKHFYNVLPLHTQSISTFCTRFQALSPTIRLLKTWFNSHKLSCHFTEECIELLAMRTFLEPYPWEPPATATTGFLRTLSWLSRWDWRTDPAIIDMSGNLSAADRSAVNTRLEAWRKIDPHMSHTALVVATSHDASGTAYTPTGKPSKVVATRMTSLARSACALVKARGLDLDAKALFKPSLKDYDVLIHLSPKAFRDSMQTYSDDATVEGSRHSRFKNLDGRTSKTPLPALAHPVQILLDQLVATFAGPLLFFHGGIEDRLITGLWSPQMEQRPFRVTLPGSFRPALKDSTEKIGRDGPEGAQEDEPQMELNKEAILAEIARIGGDLIDRIESRDK